MNRKLAQLLIKWIATVTSMLLYQTNIFPHEQLVKLANAANKLEDALGEIVNPL